MHLLLASVSSATSPAGVCRHAANIARGMAANPSVDKVTMFVGEWQSTYFREDFSLNAARLDIQSVFIANTSIARNFWYFHTLPILARKLNADIVHLAFPMPIQRSGVPIVVSLHDLYPFDIPRNFGPHRAWLNRTALRLCLKNAAAIACVSEPTRTRLHQLFAWLNPARTTIIPNSVSLPSPSVQLPESLKGSPYLLCVAQHRANKNVALLIQAFRLALDHNIIPPTFKLVIVGNEGPETPTLHHAAAESRLSDRIVFLRNLPDAVLAALYAHCELLIAPSLLEGFGLPVAEAVAAGCRIVCSDIPAFRSLAPSDSAFFDPTDTTAASLLAAIKRALIAPHIAAVSPSGLDPEQAAVLYLALYSKLKQPRPTTLPTPLPAGLRTSGDL